MVRISSGGNGDCDVVSRIPRIRLWQKLVLEEFSIQQICQGLLSEDFRGFRDNGMRKNLSIAARFWGLPSESLREGGGRIGVDIHTKVEVPPLNIQLQPDPLPCLTLWRMFRGMHPFCSSSWRLHLLFGFQKFWAESLKLSPWNLHGIYHFLLVSGNRRLINPLAVDADSRTDSLLTFMFINPLGHPHLSIIKKDLGWGSHVETSLVNTVRLNFKSKAMITRREIFITVRYYKSSQRSPNKNHRT